MYAKIKRPLLIFSLLIVAVGAASAYDACNPCRPRKVRRVRCQPRPVYKPVCAPVACPTPVVSRAPMPVVVTTPPAPVYSSARACGDPCSSVSSVSSVTVTQPGWTPSPVTTTVVAGPAAVPPSATSTATVVPAASVASGTTYFNAQGDRTLPVNHEPSLTKYGIANYASNDVGANWASYQPPAASDTPSNYNDSLTNVQASEGEIPIVPGLNY